MFNPYESGAWAIYKGQIVKVIAFDHKAPYRVCIMHDQNNSLMGSAWVHNSTLSALDPAVISLLSSLNTTKERQQP